MTDTAPPPPSRKGLVIGSLGALAVAAVALVGFILPAEFGIDPTGLGRALGTTQLAEEDSNIYLERGMQRTNVLFPIEGTPDMATARETIASKGVTLPADAELATDRFTVELGPYQSIELKYELAQGAPILFSWSATGPIDFDMHGHPYDGGEELTESYAITEATSQSAVYVAAFTGIHGWFWQNRGMGPVTLTLDTAGAMTASKTFDQSGENERALTPPEGEATEPADGPASPAAPEAGTGAAAQ